ncbi:MAG: DNA-binding protein, partial [Planctomycetota bacterium]
MAMIDAARAQQLLGCDGATFSNYVNNGTLRSQRVNGELMVEEKDVEALLAGG